ncbi:hypothetical protein H1R20_g451, partial [Candolleomyces eurysporus]
MASHGSLDTLEGCHHFIQTSPSEVIAAQLLIDREACRNKQFPSLLVHVLPSRADHIAAAIKNDPRIPLPISRMLYSDIISTIKNYLSSMTHTEETEDAVMPIPEHMVPNDEEFKAALKVLRYLQLPQVRALKNSTPLDKVVQTIHEYLEHGDELRDAQVKSRIYKKGTSKLCYMCRYGARIRHKLYPSLCNPCGEFNISSSALSLPPNLDLSGKVAVVTGGRVNLGYHTALRMLRCGAQVIVSSRYPYDAEARYSAEPDFGDWEGRLKIVGADFRTAKDVFALVEAVKRCIKEWSSKSESGKEEVLHILINNAAQTLTDSVEKEEESIRREQLLLQAPPPSDSPKPRVVVEDTVYQAKIRGGHHQTYSIQSNGDSREPLLIKGSSESPGGKDTTQLTTATVSIKSSWTQNLHEIPYEDVISAHSVNTFVPFILLRELLPLMPPKVLIPPSESNAKSAIPSGYVINVSSREGLFERNPTSSAKSGLHVHTNMSKAALNMLTETEAASAWQKNRVAINSVDPGYMSADPMFMEMVGRAGQACPIGWEDGAGRVLWPIAKGEKGEVFWGRFFKHFREIEVGR